MNNFVSAFLLTAGLILSGSEGEYWPAFNFFGVLLIIIGGLRLWENNSMNS
jgi:hypothetical protein